MIRPLPNKEATNMELVRRQRNSVIGRCEHCGREIEVPASNLIAPFRPDIELQSAVQCGCGEYHNLIVTPEGGTPTRQQRAYKDENDERLKCPRCGSSHLHAGDKGFSLKKAAVGGFLVGPAGLLGGLLGSKKIVVTCLACGHRWQAGKGR